MGSTWDSLKDPSEVYDFWSISRNKSVNELGVVKYLLQSLSVDASTLVRTEPNDPPDCVLEINAMKVGVEVVALIDERARKRSAKARRDKASEVYAEWSKESFQAALGNLVTEKGMKIHIGKANGKAASLCQKFWLVVHTDEFTLSSQYVQNYVSGLKLGSNVFERKFLILSYEPGGAGSGYPCFTLK